MNARRKPAGELGKVECQALTSRLVSFRLRVLVTVQSVGDCASGVSKSVMVILSVGACGPEACRRFRLQGCPLRLGVVTDVQTAERDGEVVSPSLMLLDVATLAPYFDEVLLFSPGRPAFDVASPRLQRVPRGNLRVVQIPGFRPRRVVGFLMGWPRVWWGLRRVLGQVDLACIRMPARC